MLSDQSIHGFLLLAPVFIVSLTLHELAHALVAYRLGDRTAKEMGRLTLNPIAHMDPLGSLILGHHLLRRLAFCSAGPSPCRSTRATSAPRRRSAWRSWAPQAPPATS